MNKRFEFPIISRETKIKGLRLEYSTIMASGTHGPAFVRGIEIISELIDLKNWKPDALHLFKEKIDEVLNGKV